MSKNPSIPVIDMQDFASQTLLEASKDWGCFRLINHSIPWSLMAEMKATVRDLLDLPMEIKQRNKDVIAGSGCVAPSMKNPLYEALGLCDIASADAVRDFCSQLEASPPQRRERISVIMSKNPSIPVIDMQDFASQTLLEASKDWGCFRLINHSIPWSLMAEMKATVRDLLDLPMEIKQRNKDVIAGSGYVAPSMKNPLYEALGLYDIASADAVRDFCSQLEASPQQRETIINYSEAVHELAMDIGRMLSQSMGLDMDLFKEWPCQFRINKYNFTPQSVGSLGVQIHTDSGFLTILQDDEIVGGLEVFDEKSGAFVAVDPLPGSVLVNFGDIAKVWSNGKFCNVRHRVQCKEVAVRISIALFVLGPREAEVAAPPQLIDADHPRLFLPFTFEDYRKLRLSTGLRAGEALALLHNPSLVPRENLKSSVYV